MVVQGAEKVWELLVWNKYLPKGRWSVQINCDLIRPSCYWLFFYWYQLKVFQLLKRLEQISVLFKYFISSQMVVGK